MPIFTITVARRWLGTLALTLAHPTQDLDGWHLVDPPFMLKKLKGEPARGHVSQWILHKGISPVDLYVYLKARFGDPNGFAMTLKSPSSDNYTHWNWTLQHEDRIIEFMGHNLHAAAYIEGVPEPTPADEEQFVANLKANFSKYGPAMSTVKRSLEKWAVFVNPFYRLRRVIDDYSERLRLIEIDKVELPGLPTTPAELKGLQEQWKTCQAVYTEALGLGTSIKMIVPVLAESFVNLLIFLLAKPEIRTDDRLYNDTIRREIDLRVKALHLNCVGFRVPIDSAAEPFKKFHTVMNGRNDFLHGNIDPRRLRYDTVHFDGTIPLPDRYQNMSELALVNSLIHVEPAKALADVKVVDEFIEFVLRHLDDRVRKTVEMFMRTPNPGWREDTRRAGVLFPVHIIHGVMGGPADNPPQERSSES